MNNERRSRIKAVASALEIQQTEIEYLKDEEQEAFDAMPEGLQESYRGVDSLDAIDNLDSALEELGSSIETLNLAMGIIV